jgi:FkbM family methyltransferase
MTVQNELPFDIVDGSISRADNDPEASLAGRLRCLPGMDRLLAASPVQHLAAAVAMGRRVRETAAFVANELRGAPGVRSYTLREGGRTVLLRHGTIDIWTFTELFVLQLYRPPPPVAAILAGVREPAVLDLGANIGLFGLDALQQYPGARITAYEPDAESAVMHRRLVERNGLADSWRLVEACAGPKDGSVTFLPGQETESRIVDEPTPGTVTLPMHDVLPAFAKADLVKLDIEGGEWPLLADERSGAAPVVVLEYHPPGCPEPDTHATARRLLERHGYQVLQLFQHPGGVGMVWAFRAEGRS